MVPGVPGSTDRDASSEVSGMADKTEAAGTTAEALATIASKWLGRRVRGREVRGIVRGGGVVKRLDDRPKGGGNRVHLFSHAEARAILTVLGERHAARTGKTLRLPAPFGTAPRRAPSTKAPRASVKAVEATEGTEA